MPRPAAAALAAALSIALPLVSRGAHAQRVQPPPFSHASTLPAPFPLILSESAGAMVDGVGQRRIPPRSAAVLFGATALGINGFLLGYAQGDEERRGSCLGDSRGAAKRGAIGGAALGAVAGLAFHEFLLKERPADARGVEQQDAQPRPGTTKSAATTAARTKSGRRRRGTSHFILAKAGRTAAVTAGSFALGAATGLGDGAGASHPSGAAAAPGAP